MKKFTVTALGAVMAAFCMQSVSAQTAMVHKNVPEGKDFTEIYNDTLLYQAPTTVLVEQAVDENAPVVLEHNFRRNWYVFGTVGAHAFLNEFSHLGKFGGLVSPDFTIGVGKWFTPGVGFKVEWERSSSRGYIDNPTSPYGVGGAVYDENGNFQYQKMKTNWWELSVSGVLNLSRLIMGYEGVGNRKLMNQFMVSAGMGVVHHMGFENQARTDNELSFRAELQYSRFFTPAKAWSLDFKIRGIFYQTNHDMSYTAAHSSSKVDVNLGLAIGATWYLGTNRTRGWSRSNFITTETTYLEKDILVIREREKEVAAAAVLPESGTMTFYVFYPNNYSGRNDAPVIAGADVNTIDYLAGGLYTQKRFVDNDAVTARLDAGRSTNGLATENIPTVLAETPAYGDLPRGYEMSNTIPLSLSLNASDMKQFEEAQGYYYAPIFDGRHVWEYRIDDATLGQTLLSDANYAETASYGLNAHSGLSILRENFGSTGNTELVSFADVYAAVNGNDGYIAAFTDPATVARIKDIFANGNISLIVTEGMATSQDNYSGENARNVGVERNSALSENRANSVLLWLQQNPNLAKALTKSSISGGNNRINTVTDKSTRGLDAKLNRGVKVTIHYNK